MNLIIRAPTKILLKQFKWTQIRLISKPPLPNLSLEQILKIQTSDAKIREQHQNLGSLDTDDFQVLRKRMIYRSKQRGWLEVDLILGSWAAANVNILTYAELKEYELVLNEETINIYNYISGKDPLPAHLQGLPIMKRIQDYAFGLGVIGPDSYASLKFKANLT